MSAAALPGAPPAFDDDAADLHRRIRRWAWIGVAAVALWTGLFALWALAAPILGAVVAVGVVKAEANRQTVTHRDGGIVAEILVADGQAVQQGQPLVRLEDARTDASLEALQAQLDAERLRASRLEAEAALREAWAPPAGDEARSGARRREALAREQSSFVARRRALASLLESVRAQLADTRAEIVATERNIAVTTQALTLMRDELASNEALLQQEFVNRTRVLGLKRAVAEYESRIAASAAEGAQARQRASELEGRRESARGEYVRVATEELRDTTARIVDLEERLRALADTAGRNLVSAPVAGRLVNLRVNTVGSALGAREPIVDIVPSGLPLQIEARVGAAAATDIAVGQEASVRLLGARQRSTGLLAGRVSALSADAIADPRSGAEYFTVWVELRPESVPDEARYVVRPGAMAEVYLRTSERTAIEFLLEPLTTGMARSFREQ
ncbi:MAG: HlyD family type I secretion periplasmic adaptor subunit [Ideonella sp.]|nr:HlyD family type I secretion periplasmic adaptor subunit [Ideonella sp.]